MFSENPDKNKTNSIKNIDILIRDLIWISKALSPCIVFQQSEQQITPLISETIKNTNRIEGSNFRKRITKKTIIMNSRMSTSLITALKKLINIILYQLPLIIAEQTVIIVAEIYKQNNSSLDTYICKWSRAFSIPSSF